MNNPRSTTSWLDQWLVAAIFAAAGLALLAFFVKFAEPPHPVHREPFRGNYSEQQLQDRLTGANLSARVDALKQASVRSDERIAGRLSGSPGFYRTENLITNTFKAAGLDLQTQEFEVVVPVTEYCQILGADGQPLPGVTLYPYAPAGLLPTVLPPEGIRADLVSVEKMELKYLDGHQPKSSILLATLEGAAGWQALADAGVPAIIVREDELAKAQRVDPDQASLWNQLASGLETTYPRFVARGPIQQFAGQTITIRCKVSWQTRKVRNLIGVLHGKPGAKEALVVNAYYDSNSYIPELAPGAEQSLSLAALLEYAEALAPYRGQMSRDIVFVASAGHAQGMAGAGQLLDAIETFSRTRSEYQSLADRRTAQVRQLGYANEALKICEQLKEKVPTPDQFKTRWLKDAQFRDWFTAAFKQVAGEVNLERRNEVLDVKLKYIRAGKPIFREDFDSVNSTDALRALSENSHPLLRGYIDAQTADNMAANLMGLPIEDLASRPQFAQWDYLGKGVALFEMRRDYHQEQIAQLDDSLAVQKIFSAYDQTLTLNLELSSGGRQGKKALAVMAGLRNPGTVVEPQVTDLANSILAKVPEKNGTPQFRILSWGSKDAMGSRDNPSPVGFELSTVESILWFGCGRMSFTVANLEFYSPKSGTPEDTWENLATGVLEQQVPVIGRSILAIAAGQVPFKQIKPLPGIFASVSGSVLASAGTSSVVPTHRMGSRTFMRVYELQVAGNDLGATRAVGICPVLKVNPYGEFSRRFVGHYPSWIGNVSGMAIRFDERGLPLYVNDTSAGSQSLFNSLTIDRRDLDPTGPNPPKPVNLSMFRAVPVTVFAQINPQTMNAYKGMEFMDNVGLGSPAKFNNINTTFFLEPDLIFYVGFKDGAADNKELLTDRAFMLNVDWRAPVKPDEFDVYGRGYLAADVGVLTTPAFDTAASMLRTGGKRLALQQKFGMADEQMIGFEKQGNEWLAHAHEQMESNHPAAALTEAGTSVAYAINNHPVIRSRVSQAVVGILWYLGLLVPFVFFTEKLLFGFPDIRKQLVASGVIFLVVFSLLRLFHPAFEMVRSSLMILLGFVILLLTFLVTMMVGGKFKQNIKDLRSKEGQVEGADINRGGVIGTAFMLGLNNMRRRKIRTGLTCATLVLITFVMICFTSVSTDLQNTEQPTGRSTWNGLMVRDPKFGSLEQPQIDNIRQLYGTRYPLTIHRWMMPDGSGGAQSTDLQIDRDFVVDGSKLVKRGHATAAVQMEWNETKFSGVDRFLLTKKGWFPRPPETQAERLAAQKSGYKDKRLVILPDTVAKELGIRPEDVDQPNTNVVVTIRAQEYEVQGIIDSSELSKVQGLDGQSILPYDINSVQGSAGTGEKSTLPPDIARLSGAQVLLVNVLPAMAGGEGQITASCMVLFPNKPYDLTVGGPEFTGLDYRTQRREVLNYLERTGREAYYGIDNVAYRGSRQRAKTFAGLLELLVPILIAALTVFNTMRGSVYERKGEIYVYNAVGIAPNHVFFMFMAEACVYAVMGAVLGYILSQGTGRLLTTLNFTGGMNMDYSSIETIYASLAITGSVLLSTLIPARDAAKLAAPSEIVSWTVPKADGDVMTFNLPFTFTAYDRVAVISYFRRWLDANGAGSSGPFFCAPPEVLVRMQPVAKDGEELVLIVASTVWLKPYDLGVSQRMEISLPTDPETGEYIARITLTRLSGHVAGWNRTLRPFLSVLRKQFLNWRATTDADRREMYAEASEVLKACAAKEESHV